MGETGWGVPAGPEWFPDASKDDAIPPADIEKDREDGTPERIWASPDNPDENSHGFWVAQKVAPSVEYIRADIEARKDAPTVDITRWHYIDVEEAGPDFDFMGMSIQEDGEWVKYADAIKAQSVALTAATERAERLRAALDEINSSMLRTSVKRPTAFDLKVRQVILAAIAADAPTKEEDHG